MKKILQNILAFLSKKVLKKYNPDIIGITGSVGKTSSKEAVFSVLKNKYSIRKNIKNYNNEIGVPLTILGCESGNRSFMKWSLIILKGIRLILITDKNYPDIIILEMGADKPGDIKYLTTLAPCKIGILTNISESHLEYFGTFKKIIKEKESLLLSLPKKGFAIINADNEYTKEIREKLKCDSFSYGFTEQADVRAIELDIDKSIISGKKVSIRGINFKVKYKGNIVPIFLPNMLGKQQIYAALAAVSAGVANGINLVEISDSLRKYKPPVGRMNIIDGIKDTVILDDTYNSSPKASEIALEAIRNINLVGDEYKYVVLGDMLELGNYTEDAHKRVGRAVVDSGIDVLVTVGEKARDIAREAKKNGMDRNCVYSFTNIKEAGIFLQDRIQEGDLILVKGSQAMRMEKIVKELMAEPLKAKELLVRQDATWK
ncbi:UDP-N-acetylmuramoyl-tripeptide--D-alanyl-D-alanine ligase [Patescibacteria group bacterium]